MTTHHAVLLSVPAPLQFDGEEALRVPMHLQTKLPQFGIADVRALIAAAHRRPSGDDAMQTLLVATEFITEEAQQALLKIVEEPPLSTAFVFVLPEGYTLLPTLESRFSRKSAAPTKQSTTEAFEAFRRSSIAERMSMIEQSTKDKNQAWQSDIKRGLTGFMMSSRNEMTHMTQKELEYVVRLLLTRGASNKFLLEHLALSLPLKTR